MNNDFWVYVAPISGSCFPSQLALLSEVYEARKIANGNRLSGRKSYMPDLCLGSSGGNITLYLGLAGNWNTEGICRCAKDIDPRCFTKPWVPEALKIIPNVLIGISKGSLYDSGYGAKSIFDKFFTEESIIDVEIWTGTYNSEARCAQFFCNRSQSDSLINEVFFNEEQYLYDSLPLKFMNGDISLISKVSVASASIPMIVPTQKIQNNAYADGGVIFSSPISVFASELYRIISHDITISSSTKIYYKDQKVYEESYKNWQKENIFHLSTYGVCIVQDVLIPKNLRMIYFMPYQTDRIFLKKETVLEKDIETIDQLIHTNMIQDRNIAINLIYRLSTEVSTQSFSEMTTTRLGNLILHLSKYKHYLIIIYPHGNPSIDLINFTPEDVLYHIEKVKCGYGIHLFYSSDLK
jgi:hypothetical protein